MFFFSDLPLFFCASLTILQASVAKLPRAILDLCGLKYVQDQSFKAPAKLPPLELPSIEFRNKIYEDVPPPTAAPPPFGPKGLMSPATVTLGSLAP